MPEKRKREDYLSGIGTESSGVHLGSLLTGRRLVIFVCWVQCIPIFTLVPPFWESDCPAPVSHAIEKLHNLKAEEREGRRERKTKKVHFSLNIILEAGTPTAMANGTKYARSHKPGPGSRVDHVGHPDRSFPSLGGLDRMVSSVVV